MACCRAEKLRQWLSTGRRVTFAAKRLLCARLRFALVAQLDRASDFESEGREFESLRARQKVSNHNKLKTTGFGECGLTGSCPQRVRNPHRAGRTAQSISLTVAFFNYAALDFRLAKKESRASGASVRPLPAALVDRDHSPSTHRRCSSRISSPMLGAR